MISGITSEVGRRRSPWESFAFRDVVTGAGPWTGRPRDNAQGAHRVAVAIGPGSEGAAGVLIAKRAPAGLTNPSRYPSVTASVGLNLVAQLDPHRRGLSDDIIISY
jgi:hypothetical protein